MDIEDISVGNMVYTTEDSLKWVVDNVSKGWITLSGCGNNANGGIRKVRAKSIEFSVAPEHDEEEEEEEDAGRMAKVLTEHKPKYVPHLTSNGQKSLSNGDKVASALIGMEVDEVLAFVEKKLGFEPGFLTEKYGHLNPGQRRMNAGNMLRAAFKRGEIDL